MREQLRARLVEALAPTLCPYIWSDLSDAAQRSWRNEARPVADAILDVFAPWLDVAEAAKDVVSQVRAVQHDAVYGAADVGDLAAALARLYVTEAEHPPHPG